MQIGPGSTQSYGDEEKDSLTLFEEELAQTIENSIHESIDDDDETDQEDEADDE